MMQTNCVNAKPLTSGVTRGEVLAAKQNYRSSHEFLALMQCICTGNMICCNANEMYRPCGFFTANTKRFKSKSKPFISFFYHALRRRCMKLLRITSVQSFTVWKHLRKVERCWKGLLCLYGERLRLFYNCKYCFSSYLRKHVSQKH